MFERESPSIFQQLSSLDESERSAALSYYMAMKTRAMLKPNHVTIELTPMCTLDCKMCYIKQEGLKPGAKRAMLSVEQWKSIIDQIDTQGVESLTLTGGECFFYDGFFEVYDYAYDKGFEIILMSNATLIDEDAVKKLVNRPPKYICVTLYGMSAETYQNLCGSGVAYAKVLHAVDLMQKAGLPLIMQTTITKENQHEVDAMKLFAESHKLAYRASGNLFSARECTSACAASETPELATIQMRNERIAEKLKSAGKSDRKIVTHGMQCGAGRNSYHINWKGDVQPCILFDAYKVSVLTAPVNEAWEQVRDWSQHVPQLVECQECPAYGECQHCVASHYAETKEFGVPAPRLCIKKQLQMDCNHEK